MHHNHQHNCPHHSNTNHHGLGMYSGIENIQKNYFTLLSKLYSDNRLFFWNEVLSGSMMKQFYKKIKLDFINSINKQYALIILFQLQFSYTCQWISLRIRPFITGLFLPFLLYIFFNSNIISKLSSHSQLFNILAFIPIILFVMVALRGSGSLSSEDNIKLTNKIYQQKPYLQSPNLNCKNCKILKTFRSFHCIFCGTCIPKYSYHSQLFNICMSANNQLLFLLFHLFYSIYIFYILITFILFNNYGLLTKILFTSINVGFLSNSLTQFIKILIFNIYYGITQHEIHNWHALQYLMNMPSREFFNNVNSGFCNNLCESFYALFGCTGDENISLEEEPSIKDEEDSLISSQQSKSSGKVYKVNWAKAFIYIIPQMPNHKDRLKIKEMMKNDEQRIIEGYKLQKKFKQEVIEESRGQNLGEFQINQRVMAKMQQYMMNNRQKFKHLQPSPEQQKNMQLQILSHMKTQFKNNVQVHNKIEQIESKLKNQELTYIEVNLQMREIQQILMANQMKDMKRNIQIHKQENKQMKLQTNKIDKINFKQKNNQSDQVKQVEAQDSMMEKIQNSKNQIQIETPDQDL